MNWLAALILLIHLSGPAAAIGLAGGRVLAQPGADIFQDAGVNYTFGEQITFQARVSAAYPVKEMLVYITPETQPTHWQAMETSLVENSPLAVTDVSAKVDVRQIRLFPFSRILYYYEGQLSDGSKVRSPVYQFSYDDNRFKWQRLENETFQVQWNGDDASLGQEILNIARQGLEHSLGLLEAEAPAPIRIYAYSSSRDLQSALQLTNQPWVAGHATPELAMILISVPAGPEKKLELQRQVPHEIMHILQYQVVGNRYTRQPVWLIEGLASMAELAANPEYRRVLDEVSTAPASDSVGLLPMQSLCAGFPRDAAAAFVAYAQSESFVRFISQKYGVDGLRALIDSYHSGQGCEEGLSAALGTSLSQLETRWQQEALGMNTGQLVLRNLSPYLLVGLLVLVPALLALIPLGLRKATA